MVAITIKWGKLSYDLDFDVSSADAFESLTVAIYSLTMVPPSRQKLLAKGKFIKTDKDAAALTDGSKLMLTGSADDIVLSAPTGAAAVMFEEDMTDAQRAAHANSSNKHNSSITAADSAGLENLGNTCYMNAVLQNLRAVPELKTALDAFVVKQRTQPLSSSSAAQQQLNNTNSGISSHLAMLFKQLDNTTTAVTPYAFTALFRSAFPQYAETAGSGGQYLQQDADEALNTLLNAMAGALTASSSSSSSSSNTIDDLFSGDSRITLSNTENPLEPASVSSESFRKLRCHISDNSVTSMSDGLLHDMNEQIERRSSYNSSSSSSNSSSIYNKKTEISRLPKLLLVQFVRFFWRRDTNTKTKILKKINFSLTFDALPLCEQQLKATLAAARQEQKCKSDKAAGITVLIKKSAVTATAAATATDAAAAPDAATAVAVDAATLAAALATPTTGLYELAGVVTHQGRYADAGHYIGWVRQPGNSSSSSSSNSNNNWWKFDDSVCTTVSSEAILQLNGGGDHAMAYLLMYRRIDDVEAERNKEKAAAAAAAATAAAATATATASADTVMKP